MIRTLSFLITAVVLGVAVILTIQSNNCDKQSWTPNIQNRLATNLNHWTWHTPPLSESEEERNKIETTLKYDEIAYRVYKSGIIELTIYAAYWKVGSSDIESVREHIPDKCWVSAGWSMIDVNDNFCLDLAQTQKIIPAQYRLMSKPEGNVHILYWHLVNNKMFYPSTERNFFELISAAIDKLRSLKRHDQYFIRLASNVAFEELYGNEDFNKIVESISQFGLVQK